MSDVTLMSKFDPIIPPFASSANIMMQFSSPGTFYDKETFLTKFPNPKTELPKRHLFIFFFLRKFSKAIFDFIIFDFFDTIESLLKNRNVGQILKVFSKIRILTKNRKKKIQKFKIERLLKNLNSEKYF